jgi:hypothetical protein
VQRTLTSSTGVPVFSGYEAFLGNPRAKENMTFSLTDGHPSCEAHAIFGQWVLEKWTRLPRARPEHQTPAQRALQQPTHGV